MDSPHVMTADEAGMVSRGCSRSFTWIDALALVIATAFGWVMTRSVLEGYDLLLMFYDGQQGVQGFQRWGFGSVPLFISWSGMLLVLRLKDWPARRRLMRSPGVVPGVVVVLLTLSEFVKGFVYQLRVNGRIWIWGPLSILHAFPSWLVEASHIAGFAVGATWLALWVGRWWRLEPDWIDRAGRVLGCYWIVMFAAHLYYARAF